MDSEEERMTSADMLWFAEHFVRTALVVDNPSDFEMRAFIKAWADRKCNDRRHTREFRRRARAVEQAFIEDEARRTSDEARRKAEFSEMTLKERLDRATKDAESQPAVRLGDHEMFPPRRKHWSC